MVIRGRSHTLITSGSSRVNHLTPSGDLKLISPYNITPEFNIKVKKSKGNDHQLVDALDFRKKFSLSKFYFFREQYGEYAYWR